jgi:hypothetical protein
MHETTGQSTHTTSPSIEEDSEILDFMVVIVENLKLLIAGPLLAGFCALGIGLLLPNKFESVMILRAESLTLAQITAAPVLDPLLEKLNLKGGQPIHIAREKLRDRLHTIANRTEKLITVTISERTPELAQTIATTLLQQIIEESKPKGFVRDQIVTQRQLAEKRITESSAMLTHLAARIGTAGVNPGSSDTVYGYTELQKVLSAAEAQLLMAQAELEGLTTSSIVQAPTLTQTDNTKRNIWLFVLAVIIAGVTLSLFVFLRHSFRRFGIDSESKEKLALIRKMLGLKMSD